MITPDYSELAESALSMPESARADLAALLLHSLDEHLPKSQDKTVEAWVDEVRRRSDQLHKGDAELVDAEEALILMRNAIRPVSGQQ